jgi:hypothetical protein
VFPLLSAKPTFDDDDDDDDADADAADDIDKHGRKPREAAWRGWCLSRDTSLAKSDARDSSFSDMQFITTEPFFALGMQEGDFDFCKLHNVFFFFATQVQSEARLLDGHGGGVGKV